MKNLPLAKQSRAFTKKYTDRITKIPYYKSILNLDRRGNTASQLIHRLRQVEKEKQLLQATETKEMTPIEAKLKQENEELKKEVTSLRVRLANRPKDKPVIKGNFFVNPISRDFSIGHSRIQSIHKSNSGSLTPLRKRRDEPRVSLSKGMKELVVSPQEIKLNMNSDSLEGRARADIGEEYIVNLTESREAAERDLERQDDWVALKDASVGPSESLFLKYLRIKDRLELADRSSEQRSQSVKSRMLRLPVLSGSTSVDRSRLPQSLDHTPMKVSRKVNLQNSSRGDLSLRNSSRSDQTSEGIDRKKLRVVLNRNNTLEGSNSEKDVREILQDYKISRQRKAAEIALMSKGSSSKEFSMRRPHVLSSRVLRLKLLLNINE